jgi:hypothetical protein
VHDADATALAILYHASSSAVVRNCGNASALALSLGRAELAVSPHQAMFIKDNIYEHMSRCQAYLE